MKLVDLWSEILPTPICCTTDASSTACCNGAPSPADNSNDTSGHGVESGREDALSTASSPSNDTMASEHSVELDREDASSTASSPSNDTMASEHSVELDREDALSTASSPSNDTMASEHGVELDREDASSTASSPSNDTMASEHGVESGREDTASTASCNDAPSPADKSNDTSHVESGREEEGNEVPLDLNWTILTPDMSCTSVDDRSSKILDGGVEEERERDGAENDMVAAEDRVHTPDRTPEYSPAFVQPDFDNLSTASNTDGTISSPTASPLHTPSSPLLSPALPHTPTISSCLATPSSSNTADTVETNSIENERGSPIQSPSVEQSNVVVIDSSDDEADTKLENCKLYHTCTCIHALLLEPKLITISISI